MAFRKFRIHYLAYFFALVVLMACSGLTPGGAPTDDIPGGGPVSLGNAQDANGGSSEGDSDSGPLVAQGQGVPSTQESTTGVGLGRGIPFRVKVRVTENGVERNCSEPKALHRQDVASKDDIDTTLPLPSSTPVVDITFATCNTGNPVPLVFSRSVGTQCVDGTWEAFRPLFFQAGSCGTYTVSAQAQGVFEGDALSSNRYESLPTTVGDSLDLVELEVTIDLGQDFPIEVK